MIHVIKGKTADKVWVKAAKLFQEDSIVNHQPSRAGDTLEVLHVTFEITNPKDRWVVSRFPAINPAFCIAEVIWIINGLNDSKYLNYWNSKLPEYAGTTEKYHGAYGHRLRKHFNVDQLKMAYETLKHNPHSRQVVLQIWHSADDLPKEQGMPVNQDVPCNLMSIVKLRNNKLDWVQIMRSNDLFLGTPHNFIQFTFLQEILAGWLGVEIGSYIHFSDSLHIYTKSNKDLNIFHKSKREVKNTDNFNFSFEQSEGYFSILAEKMELLIVDDISESEILRVAQWDNAPAYFNNMLYILCAEAARRRQFRRLVSKVISKCTNPIYLQSWKNWLLRFNANKNLFALHGKSV
jgi:thymidylate synthase